MAAPSLAFGLSSVIPWRPPINKSLRLFPEKIQITSKLQGNSPGRRVWRRRKLRKKDEMLKYGVERVPFLEEQVWKIREKGGHVVADIYRLLLSEENRYDFVNEVAAEAVEYVENNRDLYGGRKKAILHVLSNRMNEAGFYRPDAYDDGNPYKPGPGFVREGDT